MPLCRTFLYHDDLPFKLLRESTTYLGCNPRRCFEASSSVDKLKDRMNSVVDAVRKTVRHAPSDNSLVQLLVGAQMGGNDVSHRIFQILPADEQRLFSACQFKAVSEWALDLLLKQYGAREADAIAYFYRQISVIPGAESFRGFLFERLTFHHFDGIDTNRFSIRRLTDSDHSTWTYRGPIRRIDFRESTVLAEITKAVNERKPLHLVPTAPNFPAVDSILYDPDDPNAVVTCIQVTMNADHPIVVKDLRTLQRWFNSESTHSDLCPRTTRPWRFLFVVPSDMASTFELQELKGDTATCLWARKVDQYVLGLKEQTIFRRRSVSGVRHTIPSQQGEQQVWRRISVFEHC